MKIMRQMLNMTIYSYFEIEKEMYANFLWRNKNFSETVLHFEHRNSP